MGPDSGEADCGTGEQLLLSCARTSVAVETRDRIRALASGPVEWECLAAAASAHGVLPLLYRALKTACPDAIPQPAADRLRDLAHACACRNAFLAGELRRVMGLLGESGVAAVPLKGPVLALQAYGDVLLRQYWDLDILIRRHDFARVVGLLSDAGYRPPRPMSRARRAVLLRFGFECNLAREDGACCVQLHWAGSGGAISLPLDPDRLRERLVMLPLAGAMLPTLPVEELLLYLCAHGGRHCWRRLQWVCDVAELLRRHSGGEWGRLVALSRASGTGRMLSLGLLLAHDLLDAPLPADLLRQVESDALLPALAAQSRRWLFTREPRGGATAAQEFCFQLRLRERWRDRVVGLAGGILEFAARHAG